MLRYVVRRYAKSPLTTAVMVLALALGIGVNTSTFISLRSIVLHPLPYPELERIVAVQETGHGQAGGQLPLAPADYLAIRLDGAGSARPAAFARLAAYRERGMTFGTAEQSERIRGTEVSPEFFSVLGMKPLAGRVLRSGEETGGHAAVAVVSEAFAETRLGGAVHAVGNSIRLDGARYEVIGVMPDAFDWPLAAEVWVPLSLEGGVERDRSSHSLSVLGLLPPGTLPRQAAAELRVEAQRLAAEYPDEEKGREFSVAGLRDLSGDEVTSHFVVLLMGASSFVLLLACANVGNLQLARAATREREMAVRGALGASRWQLLRPFVGECVLLSLFAGLIGLALASWRNDLMKALIPPQALRAVPGLRTMHVDTSVFWFCMAVSLVVGLLSALPALFDMLRPRRGDMANEALRTRGVSAAGARHRMRGALVVMELALSLVLLVGAGLMVVMFRHIAHRDLGFQAENVLQLRVEVTAASARTPAERRSYYDRALGSLKTLPGAAAVALVSDRGVGALEIEGRPALSAGDPQPQQAAVSAGYFETLHIPLLQGRTVSVAGSGEGVVPVAVISQSLARYYWPKGDAIGHRIRLAPDAPWATIGGIAGDVIHDWFSGVVSNDVYLPYTQAPDDAATFLIRSERAPEQLARGARERLAAVNAAVPPFDVESLVAAQEQERTGVSMAEESMLLYAGIALVLSLSGLYGVVSYFVAARTHDIGVRMALGAQRADVLSLVMKEAMALTAVGLGIGIPAALLLARVMSHALWRGAGLAFHDFPVGGLVGGVGVNGELSSHAAGVTNRPRGCVAGGVGASLLNILFGFFAFSFTLGSVPERPAHEL